MRHPDTAVGARARSVNADAGSRSRARVMNWLRAAVSVGLLGWLGWTIDWSQLASLARSIHAGWILLAATFVAANSLMSAAKWNVLLKFKGIFFSFRHLLHVIWVSNFFGDFLPASVGGDALRIAAITGGTSRVPQATSTVLVDRLLSVLALGIIAALGGLWAALRWHMWDVLLALVMPVGAVLAVPWLLWSGRGRRLLSFILRRLRWLPGRRFAERLHAAIRSYRRARGPLLIAGGFSILIQINRIFFFVALAYGLGVPLGLADAFVLVPPIWFILMLPITVSGLGVQEGAFVLLLGRVGVDPTAAFGISIASRIITLAVHLPAPALFLRYGLLPGHTEARFAGSPEVGRHCRTDSFPGLTLGTLSRLRWSRTRRKSKQASATGSEQEAEC
jgi:uncharacterized protein (TIRG00374 family)